MKKFLILIFVLLFVCSIFLLNKIYIKITGNAGISIIIKEGTLTNSSATIIINDSNSNHIFGEWFRIDERVNGKWQEVSHLTDDISWISIGYNVNKDKTIELYEDWSNIYGELDPGKYRIVKYYILQNKIEKEYIYAEFTIE